MKGVDHQSYIGKEIIEIVLIEFISSDLLNIIPREQTLEDHLFQDQVFPVPNDINLCH